MMKSILVIGIIAVCLLALPVFSATSYWNAENTNLSIANTIFVDSGSRYVGIGTTAPVDKLDIAMNAANSAVSFSYASNLYHSIEMFYHGSAAGGNAIYFDIGKGSGLGQQRVMTMRGDGNVGIGTASPNSKLDVSDESTVSTNQGTNTGILHLNGADGNGNFTRLTFGHSISAHAAIGTYHDGSGSKLYFGTSNNYGLGVTNDAMVIGPTGYVGLGLTNPSVALDVSGSIEYTGTITDVSDRRLKENFIRINNPLSKIQNITGYTFNMINETGRQAGVIAQDVLLVLPEAVSVIDNESHLGVDYTQLVPLLIEGIKELKAENNALKEIVCEIKPEAEICN